MPTPSHKTLGTRVYELADQERFALLSGDFNPAHLDTLVARRELFGDVVVHGMHGVLQIMEAYFAARRNAGAEGICLRKVHARFPGPIFLGQPVDSFAVDEESNRIRLQSWHGGRLALEVQLQWEQMTLAEQTEDRVAPPGEQRRTPNELSLEELGDRGGELALYLDEKLARITFPILVNLLPLEVLAELLAVTRLVGMVCPGLRSILSTVDLELHPRDELLQGLAYEMTGVDLRFSMVKLSVQGTFGQRFCGYLLSAGTSATTGHR